MRANARAHSRAHALLLLLLLPPLQGGLNRIPLPASVTTPGDELDAVYAWAGWGGSVFLFNPTRKAVRTAAAAFAALERAVEGAAGASEVAPAQRRLVNLAWNGGGANRCAAPRCAAVVLIISVSSRSPVLALATRPPRRPSDPPVAASAPRVAASQAAVFASNAMTWDISTALVPPPRTPSPKRPRLAVAGQPNECGRCCSVAVR
jgi:hypothetical protein